MRGETIKPLPFRGGVGVGAVEVAQGRGPPPAATTPASWLVSLPLPEGEGLRSGRHAAAVNASSASLAAIQRASAASCAATILPRRCDSSLIVSPAYSLLAP